MENFKQKKQEFEDLMLQYTENNCIIAFSGGVDSTLLLKAATEQAKKNHTKVWAFTIHTVLHPMKEQEQTKQLAKEIGVDHKILHVDELKEAGIENNPVERCYLCKKYMFGKLLQEAENMGVTTVMEGTNLDDTKVYRPGIQALRELKIISPLMISGFTKADVRMLAAEYGISVSDKAAAPCMATRFPYNTELCYEEMHKADQIENYIRELGFYNVRARIHDKLVRIEVDQKDILKLMQYNDQLISLIKDKGYDFVSVDLEGFRSGSQDTRIDHSSVKW